MGSCFSKTKKSALPLPSKTANIAPPLRQHATEKGESFQRVTEMSAISMPDLKQAKEEELIRKVAVAINPIAELMETKGGQKRGAKMDCGLPPQTSAIAVLKQQEKKEEEKKQEIEKDEWLQILAIAGLRQDDKQEERRGMEKCELFPTLAVADLKQEEKEKRWGMEKCKLMQTSSIADLKQEDNEEEEGRGGTEKCELLPTLAIADNRKEEERVGTDKGELLRTSAMADLKKELQEEEEEEEKEKGELAWRVVTAITATADLEEAKEDDRMEKEKWFRVVAMTHHEVEAKEEHPKEKMEDGQSSQKPAIAEETQEKSEEKAIVKEHERSLGNFMENSEYFSEKMFRSARFESAKERLPSIIHRRIPSMESLLLFDTDENEPSQQTCSSLLVLQTLADLISKSNGRNSNEEEEEEEEDTGCDWPRQRNKNLEETKEAARGLKRENEGHGDFTFAANHSRSIKGKESVASQSSWRVINDPWRHSTEDDIVLEEIRSDDSMNEEEEEEEEGEENSHTNAPPSHHHLHTYPRHHHQHHHHHLHEEDDHQVLLPNLSLDDIILLLEKDELDQHLLSFLVSSKSSCHASDAASEASFEFKIGGSVGSTPQSTPSTPMLSAGSTPRKICQLNSMALTQDEISEIWGLFESRQSNGSCSTSNVLPPTYC